MKKSFPLILILGLCFLCCALVVGGFALFGYFESNDECSYLGPLAKPGSGVCKEKYDEEKEEEDEEDTDDATDQEDNIDGESSRSVSIYESDEYSFEYENNWYVDDSTSILYVYRTNPDEMEPGDFADNMNIMSAAVDGFSFTDSNCWEYGQDVVDQVTGQYDTIELDNANIKSINGEKSCRIDLKGSFSGFDIDQIQYFFFDEDTETGYYVTLTVSQDSPNFDEFIKMAESFEIL